LRYLLLVFLLLALPVWANSPITGVLQRAPIINPNLSTFPESSLLDLSGRLAAPAGRYGFVTVKDGHFFFEKGPRVRFYGINLAKDTVFIDKGQIDRLAALFARAGINLVRIHHIDDTQGILDPDPNNYFRAERLDLVDYWVAKLKERGIYVCLDLNDYRSFRASEGVENAEGLGRGAKPYAVFDQRLIELQKEYARKLLVEHVNPYTKLPYAQDPAIALLEIYDENGLFIRRADWPTLAQPYKAYLQQQWNIWLRLRYGTTAALKAAWTDAKGQCALGITETMEQASVQLPKLAIGDTVPATMTDPLTAPARVSDGARFAYELQFLYLKGMMDYLREIGVRIPITAVGAQDILPDLMATAAACDYIGINFYWDHPNFDPGKEWKMPGYFNLATPVNHNTNYAFPVTVSLARMPNKPLVVRELGYCFPNPFRGTGMIESAAYGAFLDLDALILFTYDAHANARTLGYFDIHLDPTRWGLVGQAARLFQSGEVAPAKYSIGIGYSEVDAFSWYQYLNSLYSLSFVTRVSNYTDTVNPHTFSLLLSSGRSCGSRWPGDRQVLFANQTHADLRYQTTAVGPEVANGYTLLNGKNGALDFTFHGIGYNEGVTKNVQAWPAFSAPDLLAKGFMPVATNETSALGFVDPGRQLIGFRNLKHDLAIRVSLDALRDWFTAPVSHADLDQDTWRSDTGQIQRQMTAGVLTVDTPTIQAIAGKLEGGAQTSALKLRTSTPIGTLTAESLDGTPLSTAGTFLVAMTSQAHNDQQVLTPTPAGPKPFLLTTTGVAPILTDGKGIPLPTRVEMNGKLLLELYLQNGTWQYLAEPDRALLYLDTGDITVNLPKRPKLVRWYANGEPVELTPDTATFTVPTGVKYTEIVW
jgi:hypothetical protein